MTRHYCKIIMEIFSLEAVSYVDPEYIPLSRVKLCFGVGGKIA
jgi:hypothetical protein